MTPASHSPDRQGRCACGAVYFVIAGEACVHAATACHCHTCRRWSGYYWAALRLDPRHVTIHGEKLRWWAATPAAERGFCSHCGSSLFFRSVDGRMLGIAPGALDDPAGLYTAAHIFCDEAGAYYRLPADKPQYPGAEP